MIDRNTKQVENRIRRQAKNVDVENLNSKEELKIYCSKFCKFHYETGTRGAVLYPAT